MNMQRGVAVLFALVLGSYSRAADVPRTTVPLAQTAPVIDGVLSETLWQRPPDAKDFRLLNSGEPAKEQTEVWLARDNTWFFIAFRCRDSKAASIACKVVSRDRSVSQDDSVEVFLSPGTAGKTYWHFILNATGVQGDNRSEGDDHGIAWDGHWRSAAKVDAKNGVWTAEMAIPLFYLTDRAGTDDAWTANFARHRGQEPAEFSTWSAVKDTFHSPKQFGTLEGMAGVKGTPVFAPVMTSVDVTPLMDIPRRYYEVRIGAANQGGVTGTVNAYAVDITREGETRSSTVSQALGPGNRTTMTVPVDVAKILVRKTRAVLTLTDALGTWTVGVEVDRRKESKPLSVVMDRSYYTDEKTGNLVYQLNLPPGILKDARLQVRLTPGVTSESAVGASEGRVAVPLSGLKPGVYLVEAGLKDAGGGLMAQDTCTLTRRAPAATGNEVKMDRWNGCALVNGKPFFPYGFIGVPPFSYPLLKRMGFNASLQWNNVKIPAKLECFAAAQKEGLMLVEVPDRYITKSGVDILHPGWLDAIRAGIREKLPEFVDAFKNHPALLAWYGVDEPGWDVHKVGCREMAEAINERDGHHPNIQLFCGAFPEDDEWLGFWDIGSVDIYTYDMTDYLRAVKAASAVTRYVQKPFWVVPLGETCSGSPTLFPPDKQRIQTYLSLIHGATGIFYFIWPVTHADTYAMFRELAAEVRAMEPALLTRPPEQAVKMADGSEPERIQAAVKSHPDGGYLLLAANMSDRPAAVEFRVSSPLGGLRAARLFPETPVAMKDGMFAERLEAMGTRAYRLTATGSARPSQAAGEGMVSVTLTMREDADGTAASKPTRQQEANLIPNPGFEEDSGWRMAVSEKRLQFDSAVAHGGKRSLRFDHKEVGEGEVAASGSFMLKPDTTYRFSGWVKGEFSTLRQGLVLSIHSHTTANSRGYLPTQWRIEEARSWQRVEKVFRTGPEPEKVECYIYALKNSFVGTAWVDDLSLAVVEEKESRNILPNSGFEHATIRLVPDRWASLPWLSITEDSLTGKPAALFTQDDKEVFEGKYSLRVRGMNQIHTAPSRNPFKISPDKTYAFSVYMKADRPDVLVWMMIDGPNQWKKALVGTTWARYFCTGKGPAATSPFAGISLRTEGAAGAPLIGDGWLPSRSGITEEKAATVWFDAAQLEEGTEPTEYVPDTYRR